MPKDNALASTYEFIGGNEQEPAPDLFSAPPGQPSASLDPVEKSSGTPGSTSQTLEGISEVWFEKASEALLAGTYQYPHRRRLHDPQRRRVVDNRSECPQSC